MVGEPGTITLDLAKIVASAQVIGIDLDADAIERVQTIEHNGGNPYVGKDLLALLHQAGYVRVQMSASYECRDTVEAVRAWASTAVAVLSTIAPQLVEVGLASSDMMDEARAAWEAWGDDPTAFYADAWCHAIGWKE